VTITDPEIRRMARRIRSAREAGGWTIQELARRADLAPSTVQKVETLQMVPSVAVLVKIARGLERSPGDFIRDEGGAPEVLHLRAKDRHRVGVRERMLVERVSGDVADSALEVWRVTHQPGSGSGDDDLCFDGEVVVVCEEGALTIQVGGDAFLLEEGDSLHFRASRPHRWRNDGPGAVRFLYVGTLPAAVRAAIQARISRDPGAGSAGA
jgi:transcriptional regulator with XRE-family HTH domain